MSMDQSLAAIVPDGSDTSGRITLPGGAPVPLPRGPACWQVMEGSIEVYLTGPDGRHLLMVAKPGDVIFGLPDATMEGTAISLVTADAAALAKIDSAALDVAEHGERWVRSASGTLPETLPEPNRILASGEELAVGEHEILATSGQVLWLQPGPGLVLDLNATGHFTLDPRMVCIHGPMWARAIGSGPVRAHGIEALGVDRISEAIASFTQSLIPLLTTQNARNDARALERLVGQDPSISLSSNPLHRAFSRIADHFSIKPADRQKVPDSAGGMPIPALARIAGFRARKITLEAGWHRRDHGPLLIHRTEEHAKIEALTWDGRGYASDDGRLTETRSLEYQHTAFTVSAALPTKVIGLWSLAWHVMRSGNRGDAMLTAAAAAGASLIGILTPLGTGWLLSDIVPAGMFGLLIAVGIALAAGALITITLNVARTVATTRIEGRGATVLGAALTDRLLRLPTRFFKDYSAGDLNQRLENVEQMRQLAVSVVMSAGLTAVLSVVYLGVLLFYDARLAAMGIGLVTVYILAVILARVLQMEAIREAAHLDGEIAGLTYETLEGVGKLRSAAAEERAMERWLDVYRRERAAGVRAGRVGVNFGAFADTYQTVTLMTLFAGAGMLSVMETSAGMFIAFLAAFGSFQGAIVGLSHALLQVYSAQPLVERARPILKAAPEIDPGRTDPGPLKGAIEGSGLSFAYGEGLPPILNNLSFEVRPGEHMAIVGGSGSGKSTLLRLLLGFETPQRGSILYDGQDLARLDLTRVRSQIGVVLQASQLFAGSILENIRGASNAPLEECLEAVAKAGLAPDLQTFAMGIHTPITEGAGTLSGGQRQRILIARALAADPNVLFFDEATSALDNATQAIVSTTLDQLRVTRITIAHRLSTVRNADRICVLKDGKFVEQGRFEDLMALDGAFAALARRQLTGE